jgi:hypothetical protein
MSRSAPILIGLTGQPGVGKDTCAQLLERHGYRSTAFSEALYLEIGEAFGLGIDLLQHRDTKELPLACLAITMCRDAAYIDRMHALGHDLYAPRSPRWTLQQWGTEYRRAQDPTYWLRRVAQWVGRQRGIGCGLLIVRDVKLQNEADLVRALGGEVWRVLSRRATALHTDTQLHASEAQAAAIATDDMVINDGSFEALEAELLRAIGQARARNHERRAA